MGAEASREGRKSGCGAAANSRDGDTELVSNEALIAQSRS